MQLSPLLLVVVAANVLGGVMAIPQARQLVRERNASGVSGTWAVASITVNAWWIAYGLGAGDLGIVPVSVVSVTAYLVITVCVTRFSPIPARSALAPALAAGLAMTAIPLTTLLVAGWVVTGIALGALYGVQLAPAVVAVYRVVDVRGVSLATWLIAFAEAGLWGVYGLAGRDVGLMALAATGLLMSSLVLPRLLARRPRRVAGAARAARAAGAATLAAA